MLIRSVLLILHITPQWCVIDCFISVRQKVITHRLNQLQHMTHRSMKSIFFPSHNWPPARCCRHHCRPLILLLLISLRPFPLLPYLSFHNPCCSAVSDTCAGVTALPRNASQPALPCPFLNRVGNPGLVLFLNQFIYHTVCSPPHKQQAVVS